MGDFTCVLQGFVRCYENVYTRKTQVIFVFVAWIREKKLVFFNCVLLGKCRFQLAVFLVFFVFCTAFSLWR